MKLFSPSCGLIYNMLKNSKSVTLFVIFFQKKITPAFTGAIVKGNHNYNKQAGFVSRKECMFFIFYFYWFPPVYNMRNNCPHRLPPRGQVTKKGKENLASNMMSRGVSLYGQNAAISFRRFWRTTPQPRRGLPQSCRPVTLH